MTTANAHATSFIHFSKTLHILLLLKHPLIYYYSYALRSIVVVVVMAVVVLAVAVLLLLLFSITSLINTCLSIVEWEEKAGLILLG